jgi:syndecan 4
LNAAATTLTSVCVDCAVGTATAVVSNAQQCNTCPAGRFSNTVGAMLCQSCAADFYVATAGANACIACPSTKTTLGLLGQTACNFNVPATNTVSNGNGQEQFKAALAQTCPLGKYVDATGTCLACASGTFQPSQSSATACFNCAPGTYSDSGSSSCTACAFGSSAGTAASICTSCVAGKFASASGSSTCQPCSAGKAQAATGQKECQACAVDQFVSTSGALSCNVCAQGKTTQSASGQSACIADTECLPGTTKTVQRGKEICQRCAKGTFSNTIDGQCQTCAAGTYDGGVGSTACFDCAPGTF